MKATARFVIPNISASSIGLDLTELYEVDIKTTGNSAEGRPFAICEIIQPNNKFAPFLLEIADTAFEPHTLAVRAWFVYNYRDEENSRLFRGALEIRAIHP